MRGRLVASLKLVMNCSVSSFFTVKKNHLQVAYPKRHVVCCRRHSEWNVHSTILVPNNGSVREMKGFYECFLGKFASHMTVPFHCVLDILCSSNDGKLFLDKTSHVY